MKKLKTKNGATSFYIVMFAALLLSVITVSFITIMNSNIKNTTNEDLSSSAYDSALAGIEDAKIALTMYHNCLDLGKSAGSGGDCGRIIKAVQEGITNDDCNTVANALGRVNETASDGSETSVEIQEGANHSNEAGSSSMLQAYTCVKIAEDLPDYRSTLTSEKRSIVIPLRTSGELYKNVNAIKIMWYEIPEDENPEEFAKVVNSSYSQSGLEPRTDSVGRIPSLLVDLFQTGDNFQIGSLSTAIKRYNKDRGKFYYDMDRVSIFLHPSEYTFVEGKDSTKPQIVNYIAKNSYDFDEPTRLEDVTTGKDQKHYIRNVDLSNLADKLDNPIANIKCSNATFMCTAVINLPQPTGGTRIQSTFFLRLSLPYADKTTTFSVAMCTNANCSGADAGFDISQNNSSVAHFTGVQARIDSTGRANDIYRRVDTRVELVETGFPFPEYEVWMAGGSSASISKGFWVTQDCRTKIDSKTEMKDCEGGDGRDSHAVD